MPCVNLSLDIDVPEEGGRSQLWGVAASAVAVSTHATLPPSCRGSLSHGLLSRQDSPGTLTVVGLGLNPP